MSSNQIHVIDAGNANTLNVSAAGAAKVDGSAVTQPVSGTVTANAGTNLNTASLALDATITGGTQKTKLVDTGGTNVAAVSASNALKVDGSAVTQPVSGTVTSFAGSAPSAANILAGSTTAGGGTVITIPINRIWMGWVSLSASVNGAAGAVTATPSITIQSSGVSTPASATALLQLSVSTPAQATTPTCNTGNSQMFIVAYAPSATNTATLQLNLNSATNAAASANGWLI